MIRRRPKARVVSVLLVPAVLLAGCGDDGGTGGGGTSKHKSEPNKQVHQYICGEACHLLPLGGMRSEIAEYVGNKITYGGFTTYGGRRNDNNATVWSAADGQGPDVPYSEYDHSVYYGTDMYYDGQYVDNLTVGRLWPAQPGNDIIEGCHEEDLFDVFSLAVWDSVFGLSSFVLLDPFFNGADEVFDPAEYDGSFMFYRHYWVRSHDASDAFGDCGLDNLGWVTMGAYEKAQIYWDDYVLPYYQAGNKSLAYYYLGRVAHLLADMSVPAHAHGDPHWEGWGPIDDTDAYETYIGSHYQDWDHTDWTGGAVDYDSLSSLRSQEWQDTDASWNSQAPLFHLFYYMAEKADDYGSSDLVGEALFDTIESDTECSMLASGLMPLAMACTAELYKLFWAETHPPATISVTTTPVSGDIYVNGSYVGTGSYSGQHASGEAYTVSFGDSPGYYTPNPRTFVLPPSGYSMTGTYSLAPAVLGNYLTRSVNLRWDDRRGGDGDSIPEAGESVELEIRLRNAYSSSTLSNVEGFLSTSAGNVGITDPDAYYGYLDPDETSWGGGGFDITFNFSSTTNIPFTLRAEYMKDSVEYYQEWNFTVTVYENGALEPRFAVDNVVWDDSNPAADGDNDGVLESGESARFYVYMKNVGNADATDVDVRVEINSDHLELAQGSYDEEDYPDLPAGGDAQPPLSGGRFSILQSDYGFAGIVYADLVVTYSASAQVQVIHDYPLFVIEPAPWLVVRPSTWDFGTSGTDADVHVSATIHSVGSKEFTVTGITPSHSDTTWTGDALPWTLVPGESKTINVTIATAALQGNITREAVVVSDARLDDPGEDDRIIITGLVSDTLPVGTIPGVTGANNPDISGNIIVWNDARNGNQDILAYNVQTGEETLICGASGHQVNPRISGNLIAWEDNRGSADWDHTDIYACEIGGSEFVVSSDPADEKLVGVDGNRVAFLRDYYVFTERSNWDTARNMWIYEHGTGMLSNLTNFTSNPDHNPMGDVTYNADFGGGLLVWCEQTLWWNTGVADPYWDNQDGRVKKIRFGVDVAPVQVLTGFYYPESADTDRFVWVGSVGSDEEVFIWDAGAVSQVTNSLGDDPGDDCLAIGGDDIVYDYRTSGRPGLYWWDLLKAPAEAESAIDYDTTDPDNLRMDGFRVVWIDWAASSSVRYTFLRQPNIAVASASIMFSPEEPLEGGTVSITVPVRNSTKYDCLEDITVRVYDGDPDAGGTQLGTDQVIVGGLASQAEAQVQFSDVPVGAEGTHQIYARVSVAGYDIADDNTASKELTVQDSDTAGPEVFSLVITEYLGDSDGVIESGEQARIAYSLLDPSGIASTTLRVDGAPVSTNLQAGEYVATVGPLSQGNHTITIESTDSDTSPAMSTYSRGFVVGRPPVADAGADQTANEGALVSLSGTGSSDPDGDALNYSWAQTAGTTVTLNNTTVAQPTFCAPDADPQILLTFELTVSDGTFQNTAVVSITVQNAAPAANAGADQSIGEGSVATLDGTGSSDPGGDPLTYSWTQTAGPTVTLSSSSVAQPTFTAPEVTATTVLTFELTVSDGDLSDLATVNVTVNDLGGGDDGGCSPSGSGGAGGFLAWLLPLAWAALAVQRKKVRTLRS